MIRSPLSKKNETSVAGRIVARRNTSVDCSLSSKSKNAISTKERQLTIVAETEKDAQCVPNASSAPSARNKELPTSPPDVQQSTAGQSLEHIRGMFDKFMSEMTMKFNNLSSEVAAAIAKIDWYVSEKEPLLTEVIEFASMKEKVVSLSNELEQTKVRLSALEKHMESSAPGSFTLRNANSPTNRMRNAVPTPMLQRGPGLLATRWLYMSHVSNSYSSDSFKQYVATKLNCLIINCEEIKISRVRFEYRNYKIFKVELETEEFMRALRSKQWPAEMRIREFYVHNVRRQSDSGRNDTNHSARGMRQRTASHRRDVAHSTYKVQQRTVSDRYDAAHSYQGRYKSAVPHNQNFHPWYRAPPPNIPRRAG